MTTPPDRRPAVVKLGGSTLGAHDTSLRDIAEARRAGTPVVVVHGGGATISAWLARAGLKAEFVRGLRVTGPEALEVVVAVLSGIVNKTLVAQLGALGAPAFGLSGADGLILQAQRYDDALGAVGKIHRVNPFPVQELLDLGYVPVIAPIAVETGGTDPRLLNTNADTAAGEIAAALGAAQLVFLTDVDGVLDTRRNLMADLRAEDVPRLLADGVATGGMIPKLEAAVRAAAAGCRTRIVNGTLGGALADALAGRVGGTTLTP